MAGEGNKIAGSATEVPQQEAPKKKGGLAKIAERILHGIFEKPEHREFIERIRVAYNKLQKPEGGTEEDRAFIIEETEKQLAKVEDNFTEEPGLAKNFYKKFLFSIEDQNDIA